MNNLIGNEIKETLKAAKLYLHNLKALNQEVGDAKHQISSTARDTENNVESTFNHLLQNITEILAKRKNHLINRIHVVEQESLHPLEECTLDISKKIDETQKLLSLGEDILLTEGDARRTVEFCQNSSLGNLPAIPELKEVPYISFQCQAKVQQTLEELCAQLGELTRIAPVQISQTHEKPGAILVEWDPIESDEQIRDIQDYRLQRAFGDVTQNPHLIANFSDCFVGCETQFLSKDIRSDQSYSFRVCCKFEGSNEWSPWSLSQVARTSIAPFSWADNPDYILADDNKIATPLKDSPSVLVSNGPQFFAGCTVEFTYLEFEKKGFAAIGLAAHNEDSDQHFLVDSHGQITVNGKKKLTKLPEAKKGLKVSFTCEFINDTKLRINVDSSEKRVTYDWNIGHSGETLLYFTAQLSSPSCKIMVE